MDDEAEEESNKKSAPIISFEEMCEVCRRYRETVEERRRDEKRMWMFEVSYFLIVFGSLFLATMCSR